MKTSVIAPMAMAVAALARTASAHDHHHDHHHHHMSERFRECLCWNSTTNEFCLGSDFYNTDVCQHLAGDVVGWMPAALVASLAMMLFPGLFYLARWCCRCCGGRYATNGCCCADNSSRATFPGYTNRAIRCTRIFFALCVIATLPVTIVLFGRNGGLRADIVDTSDAVASGATSFQATLKSGADAAAAVAFSGEVGASSGFAPASLVAAVREAHGTYGDYVDDITRVTSNVQRVERHTFGRFTMTWLVPASGLLLLAGAAFLAVTHLRQFVGLVMIGMCFHAATVLILATPLHGTATVAHLMCENYESTVVPIVKGQASRLGMCANPTIAAGVATTTTNAMTYITSPSSDFCKDYKTVFEASTGGVAVTPCDDFKSYTRAAMHMATNQSQAALAIDAVALQVLLMGSPADATAAVRDAAARLNTFASTTALQLIAIVGPLGALNAGCGGVEAALANVSTFMCHGGLDLSLHQVANLLTALVPLGIFTIIALIRGMKRFRPLNSYNAGRNVDEAAPIMGGGAVVVGSLHGPGQLGALNDDAVSGVVVTSKDVAYVEAPAPRTSYGTADDENAGYHRV